MNTLRGLKSSGSVTTANKDMAMDPKTETGLCTGNNMPVLGLGTWQLTENTAETVETALLLGYRLIDTSGDYGTQPGIGEGIGRSGVERSDFYRHEGRRDGRRI